MTYAIRIACAFLLVSPKLAGAETPRNDVGQNCELRMESADDPIPFQPRGGFLIVVDGKLGPLSGLKFALDTGTTHSVLDVKLADKLSLPHQSATVLNFDRRLKVGLSNVPELQIGALRVRNLRVMVAALGDSTKFADNIDGVIGLDVIHLCRSVRIDFNEKRLVCRSGHTVDMAQPDRSHAVGVRLDVQGQKLLLILDTGVNDIVLFKDRIRKRVPRLKLGKRDAGREGWLAGEFALLQGIRVGSEESQAYVFLIQKAPQSLPADIDGFLGVRALNFPSVELNFETPAVRFIGTTTATLALNGAKTLNDMKIPNEPKSSKQEKKLR